MPATEKTWRDQAAMHVIFGICALVMLVSTIWMLAKDHNREWRSWQLDDRARERWTIEAQFKQAEADSSAELSRLRQELLAAQSSPVEQDLVTKFKQLVERQDADLANDEQLKEAPANFSALDKAAEVLEQAANTTEKAPKTIASARGNLLSEMNTFVHEAKRRENKWLTQKKLVAADQTAEISARGIAIGEGRPTAAHERRIQANADRLVRVDAYLADAKDYRIALETIVKDIQSQELDLQKRISAIEIDLKRLRDQMPGPLATTGEWINRAPVLDALYTGDIKLDQIWLPDMKINYNFSSVARYDRCIVCHRTIDKSAPGSATEPAYPAIPRAERVRTVQLQTPAEAPSAPGEGESATPAPTITSVYGLVVTSGQVDPNDVTVQVVVPQSLAAMAGLEMGDVILQINGGDIDSQDDVEHYLLGLAKWGNPIDITIRRGLNQPFTSHPRLDLFVGSTSPHKMGEMGCTICHDGQGSATDFKWASHTPDNPQQALEWSRKHGWFNNHHWIFPMTPERFIESNCLKCHHEVVELEPSERFPEPPAPKLVHGYKLVSDFGCYGCHEIPGYDGPTKRIGPDLRLEPNFAEVAQQIATDPGLNDQERAVAAALVEHPHDDNTRHELLKLVRADIARAATPAAAESAADEPATSDEADEPAQPRLSAETHSLADALKDVDAPGRLRKVGPSLRHLASKVEFDWLYSWIRRPADFRPSTRMPQFFLQHEHLDNTRKEFAITDASDKEVLVTDREYTARFEDIEIRALTEFLLADSQPFEYLEQPQGITEAPSPERGKWQFESRGCLACHSHSAFPGMNATQGPDLSRVAAKLTGEKGQRWLYSWAKAPNRYHARTVMPNVFLDPIAETDPSGNPTGKVTDPAADVMAFLLSVPADWKPEVAPPNRELSPGEKQALHELTAVWLSASFPKRRAERFAKEGIPADLEKSVKVDERLLVGPFKDDADKTQRQLQYVARRSLSRYGCFGCHDIPGYETAKPIGTPLASWGRKDPSQLAFENIGQFLATHGLGGTEEAHAGHGNEHGLDPLNDKYSESEAYFLQSLNNHERNGFLWQKLRMPRSFDFQTTRTKRYDERLRMPRFEFDEAQREAMMTFVLGLTNEAPAERYIFRPNPRQKAIVDGRHVLEKYNCAGCHVLDVERWDVVFEPDWFTEPPPVVDFPFVLPDFMPDAVKASLKPDRRGLLHAELHGMPAIDEETGAPLVADEDGQPIPPDDTETKPFQEIQLYQHAIVAGAPRVVGTDDARLLFPADPAGAGLERGTVFPSRGGDLAKYLYTRVIAEERKVNPSVVATEAWGWLPPPLHHEGEKVQTDWLHDFLMDPTKIRPAVVLRMPNFHMSSAEAAALVDYFAAKSSAEFPYEYIERRRGGYLSQLESVHPTLLDDAMKIVTDVNYCVKCHSVGDYEIGGSPRAQGPRLDEVYRRLRPEFTRRWIASPMRILPYTPMPVNIPYNPDLPNLGGVNQALFPGTSVAQLDGVVDLLMNFDEYAKRRTSVKSLVKEAPQPDQPTQPPTEQPSASDTPPDNTSAQN